MDVLCAILEEIAMGVCAVSVTLCTLIGGEFYVKSSGDTEVDVRVWDAKHRAIRARGAAK